MTRHKWADVIIAWAEGREVQYKVGDFWHPVSEKGDPWLEHIEYRIKPEPKEDIRVKLWDSYAKIDLVFVFDGETKEFKTVEYYKNVK
jgi:hypothetical protein